MELSFTEENYLKAIFALDTGKKKGVATNAIAEKINTRASSVTDMVKKLSEKKLVNYEKYQGVSLTREGKKIAIETIRKHRLWEVFLVDTLGFGWDEVHEIAEQLEHIHSNKLINRLDDFLGNPQFDPHGDPIPDKHGRLSERTEATELASCPVGAKVIITGVMDTSSEFLIYLNQKKLALGVKIKVSEQYEFDKSMVIELKDKSKLTVSNMVTKNLLVKKI